MIKQISIIVDSTEDNERIEKFVKEFVDLNFQKCKESKINIDNIIDCPKCKENQLIPYPVNAPVEEYYCHFCNQVFKKEEVENGDKKP